MCLKLPAGCKWDHKITKLVIPTSYIVIMKCSVIVPGGLHPIGEPFIHDVIEGGARFQEGTECGWEGSAKTDL